MKAPTISQLNKYLISIHYESGTVLGTVNKPMDKTKLLL